MKRNVFLLALLFSCLGFRSPGRANHFIGGEIGYSTIAPGVIIAEFKGYFDCQAVAPPASMVLNLRSAGCSNTVPVTVNLQAGATRKLDPYCKPIGNACSGMGRINFQEAIYNATVMLPAQCPEWILSFQDCSKPPVTNLVSSAFNCYYIEAYMNMAVGQPVSPRFYPMPAYMVTVNSQATILNLAARRGTEDSIAYTLKPAMDDVNTPSAYNPGFTFANFVPSATGVHLNSQTGLLTFIPNIHNPVPGYDANAYTFVLEATAYKKLNGVMTKISSTQRNMQVLIENVMPNQNPFISNIRANGLQVQPNDIIEVAAGDPLVFQFDTEDGNTSDSVSVLMQDPANPYMPWSVTYSTTNNTITPNFPTGTFTWDTNNATPGELTYFPITVKDNTCPLRGVSTFMFGVKILPRTTGIRKNHSPGLAFSAFPNPFSEAVSFKISGNAPAEAVAIYNLLGEQIALLPVPRTAAANQMVTWQNAASYASGTYLARLKSGNGAGQTIRFLKN